MARYFVNVTMEIFTPDQGVGEKVEKNENRDARWFADTIAEKTQEHIIHTYATMVKPGGKLVYATCSILKEENQSQVEGFLQSEIGKQFTLEKEQFVSPAKSGFDGFYMAKMLRS